MTDEGRQRSVTRWIRSLEAGDNHAAEKLWNRYFEDLVRLARARLRGASRAMANEEDAALSAFDGFCKGVARGRYPQLEDREDLWRLLDVITERKAFDQARRERRQKRGGGFWGRRRSASDRMLARLAEVRPGRTRGSHR
jgi:ECF sigma factor